jgi:hypothetical protein
MLQAAASAEDRTTAIITAAVWASAKTLLAVLSELESTVSGLSEEQWEKATDIVGRIQSLAAISWNGRTRSSQTLTHIPTNVSDRLLFILVSRGDNDARRSFYLDRLTSYRGTERVTLETAQTVAVEMMVERDCNWQRELDAISHAYQRGVLCESAFMDQFHRHAQRKDLIPRAVATRIVENAESYPSILVQVAQAVCANAAATDLVSVGSVARREHWFEET